MCVCVKVCDTIVINQNMGAECWQLSRPLGYLEGEALQIPSRSVWNKKAGFCMAGTQVLE